MVVIGIHEPSRGELVEIIVALRSLRFGSVPCQHRPQRQPQYRERGNDHEQFSDRETFARMFAYIGEHLKIFIGPEQSHGPVTKLNREHCLLLQRSIL